MMHYHRASFLPVADPVFLKVEQRFQHLAEYWARLALGEPTSGRQRIEHFTPTKEWRHDVNAIFIP